MSDIESFKDLINNCSYPVFFTGAGISTESGIPDFRSPGTGLWNKIKPIQFQDFVSSEEARRESWRRKFDSDVMASAEPNAGHQAIQEWFEAGRHGGVITQNVDRLHQRAGSQRVIDLHGRLDQVKCLDCGHITTREAIQNWIEAHNALPNTSALKLRPDGDADLPGHYVSGFRTPQCQQCGGVVMPEVVFFGGTVPRPIVDECYQMIDASEGMLVIGSSLSVYSGLRFCRYAVDQGRPLIILNQGQTRADDFCTRKFTDTPFALMAQCADAFLKNEQEPCHG